MSYLNVNKIKLKNAPNYVQLVRQQKGGQQKRKYTVVKVQPIVLR